MSSETEGSIQLVTTPRTFKLRRIKPSPPQDVIQQNLLPLKENIKKKKRAQEAYYENHSGISPLIRDFKKGPVHQRLGRRLLFNGTNTSAIPPKRKLRRVGSFNNQQSSKRVRIFTAQQRLNRIRAQQREMLNAQNFNSPKKFKLRRTLPQRMDAPTNLQVQVKNNNAFWNMQPINHYKRFKQILNAQLQQEIKKIQLEFVSRNESIPPMRVTPVATSLSLHARFATLS